MQLHSFCCSFFVLTELPIYFISIEIFSYQNNIFANIAIIGGGAMLKQSFCRKAIEQKKLKNTGLIPTCIKKLQTVSPV